MAKRLFSWNVKYELKFVANTYMLDFASSALAPVWAFTVFVLADVNKSKSLTPGIVFATLGLFELLNNPIQHVITGVEDIRTITTSFCRVQEYLRAKEREDYRNTSVIKDHSSFPRPAASIKVVELPLKDMPSFDHIHSDFAASVKDGSVSYLADESLILNSVSFHVLRGRTTMVYGPVGSGKSTILKMLLGEVPLISGSVYTNFSTAAYCPQSPWLTWGTIRSNIVGMSTWDRKWYDTVVSALALSTDFTELTDGDHTHVGTMGSRLSGGQRIRVVNNKFK